MARGTSASGQGAALDRFGAARLVGSDRLTGRRAVEGIVKIRHISRPVFGPRGGMNARGSISIIDDESGCRIHVMVDSSQAWSSRHREMFEELSEALISIFGKTNDFKEQGKPEKIAVPG